MEADELLTNSKYCRLCGQENKNGIDLYTGDERSEDLCNSINTYLPVKIENGDPFPKTICPGCHIQLEATKMFMELIIEGQEKLRYLLRTQQHLYNREEEERQILEQALQNHNPKASVETYTIQADENGEKYIIQIYSDGPLFSPEHQLALKAEGLSKPKRKRGRPPKASSSKRAVYKPSTNEKVPAASSVLFENQPQPLPTENLNVRQKRKIRPPARYEGIVQDRELVKILRKGGVIDEDTDVLEEKEKGVSFQEKNNSPKTFIGKMIQTDGEAQVEQLVFMKKPSIFTIKERAGSSKQNYVCEICKKEFQHYGRCETHKRTHKIAYACQQRDCSVQDDNREVIVTHQNESGHQGISAFDQISKNGMVVLEDSAELPVKMECVQEEKPLKCEKCDKTFSCKQNYEVHLKAVHGGERPFQCDTCKKTFAYACTLKNHMVVHNRLKESTSDPLSLYGFNCDECEKSFQHPSSLLYHKDTEHGNRTFVCNKCNKSFKHRQLLLRHQLVHTEDRPFKCAECNKQFKCKTNLLSHENIHKGIKRFVCPICGKLFLLKTSLWIHLKMHDGHKPHKCDICKKAFSQKGNLVEHQRIHTGEKPFTCDLCGRSFTTSSQCKLHMKRHTGEKPYSCKHCPKQFLHKERFDSHIRRHLGERPFHCKFCTKSFPEQWACTRHERIHLGLKKYKCDVCDRPFSDSANLSKHKKIHLKNGIKPQTLDKKPEENVNNQTIDDSQISHVNIQYLPATQSEQADKGEEPAIVTATSGDIQIHDLLDNDGNAISITTADGQPIPIVSSGNEKFQGLLPDGTLVSFDILSDDKTEEEGPTDVRAPEVDLLNTQIQFLEENSVSNASEGLNEGKPAFLSEDGKVCFITSFDENSFLTMS